MNKQIEKIGNDFLNKLRKKGAKLVWDEGDLSPDIFPDILINKTLLNNIILTMFAEHPGDGVFKPIHIKISRGDIAITQNYRDIDNALSNTDNAVEAIANMIDMSRVIKKQDITDDNSFIRKLEAVSTLVNENLEFINGEPADDIIVEYDSLTYTVPPDIYVELQKELNFLEV